MKESKVISTHTFLELQRESIPFHAALMKSKIDFCLLTIKRLAFFRSLAIEAITDIRQSKIIGLRTCEDWDGECKIQTSTAERLSQEIGREERI